LILVHPAAVAEAGAARVRYAERDPAVARRFLKEYDRAFARVRDHPDRWPHHLHLASGFRWCRLRRFPYAIIYEVFPTVTHVLAAPPIDAGPVTGQAASSSSAGRSRDQRIRQPPRFVASNSCGSNRISGGLVLSSSSSCESWHLAFGHEELGIMSKSHEGTQHLFGHEALGCSGGKAADVLEDARIELQEVEKLGDPGPC
jgi:hypothetical protein